MMRYLMTMQPHSGILLATLAIPLAISGCVPKSGPAGSNPSGGGTADPAHNLLQASDFDDGIALPWTPSFPDSKNGTAEIQDGAYCMIVNAPGDNPWDAQIRHREMVVKQGHTYSVSLRVWADKETKIRPKIGQAGPPFREYWREDLTIGTEPRTINGKFRMQFEDDPTVEFAIHAGGQLATAELPFKVCVDDVILSDPQHTPSPRQVAAALPSIRVSQVGYLPKGSKLAVVVDPSGSPLQWQLQDSSGGTKLSGETIAYGQDKYSDDNVHLIDFTAFQEQGAGFVLVLGDNVSDPFDIDPDVYSEMKIDAARYFYHNRSGIEIEMPYAGEEKWARPAGHLTSDKAVPCAPDTGCDYTLDVTGGWYDAGDHGKYVVNGGITVWTLLNLYETTRHMGGNLKAFGDGTLNIPESHNRESDLLDEVRWQMDWMMKMQVPDGKPKAGMAHHKVHDIKWTALGIAPHDAEQKMKRHLRPPSTAATLNLAATGAMCARIWKTIEPSFAQKCLTAAEKAWRAAKANPAIFALPSDNSGGGPYDDDNVKDEFYWAAAELFITTGKNEYRNEVLNSPSQGSFPMEAGGATSSMTWDRTDALGKISLSIVPNRLGANTVAMLRKQIVNAANEYLKMIDATGYKLPFDGAPDGTYPWGSNSFVLNNMVLMSIAYDLTKQNKYFEGVTAGMGYLMGRNPMAISYVTGYGARPLKHPHHRFWAAQVDARFPEAPPGAISGGPNSGMQDPYVQAAGLKGCAPQKCFVDHMEAWSANEITINWNAPFTWLTFFLDEKAH